MTGKYDWFTPPDLETRVRNLVNWWRECAAEYCDDNGSIATMAAQLEKALAGKNSGEA